MVKPVPHLSARLKTSRFSGAFLINTAMSNDIRRWMTLVEGQVRLVESTPRTLYHGTLRKFLPSIQKHGLWPTVGEFTSTMYDIEEDAEFPELVFAADKRGLKACFSAIAWLINKHYGERYTVDLIKKYGALCVLRHAEEDFTYRQQDGEHDHPNYYTDHPSQAEPGDYYSENGITIDAVLTGNKMLQYFTKYAGLRRKECERPGARNPYASDL